MRNEITIYISGIDWMMGECCNRYVKVPKGVCFEVDWGDGKVEKFVGSGDYIQTHHNYPSDTSKYE